MRQAEGGEPDLAAGSEATTPDSRRSDPLINEPGVEEWRSRDAREAWLVRRARRQALWLMAGSSCLVLLIVVGIWMVLR